MVLLYSCVDWNIYVNVNIKNQYTTRWLRSRRPRVSENRVLRGIFGVKWEEVTGECRKLHNEELNDLYSLSNNVRVIKSRWMGWAGHVARMEVRRGVNRIFMGNLSERDRLGDICKWGIILWWNFRKWNVAIWTWSNWLRIGTGGGHLWLR